MLLHCAKLRKSTENGIYSVHKNRTPNTRFIVLLPDFKIIHEQLRCSSIFVLCFLEIFFSLHVLWLFSPLSLSHSILWLAQVYGTHFCVRGVVLNNPFHIYSHECLLLFLFAHSYTLPKYLKEKKKKQTNFN